MDRSPGECGLIRLLTRFAGIAENENRPLFGTRGPLQATVRHALWLCFQKQDEIASRDRLFHRQGDPIIPQHIRDTVPYFLGAVDEDHFLRQNELDDARAALRQLETQREALKRTTTVAVRRARQFLLDGKAVGLVDERFEGDDVELLIKELRKAVSTDVQSPTILSDGGRTIARLQDELHTLRQQLSDALSDTRATRHFLSERTTFTREATEQRGRLTSLGLFQGKATADDICPLCESNLTVPTPSTIDLQSSLARLDKQLETVGAESPHLQQRLDDLNKKKAQIEEALVSTQRSLERAYADDARAQAQRDQVIERARIIGRISAFLDQTTSSEESTDIDKVIGAAQQRVTALMERVNAEDIGQRVDTFLNLISDRMSDYAKRLKLEHTGGRIRLDLKKLTIVADTPEGPIPLTRMGSGENWIGFHVLTHLALHWWFRAQKRPVPSMLIFDQPSQAHYPPDTDQTGRLEPLADADRKAVHDLFQLMYEVAEEIGDGFQLIVLDHAHLDDSWFEDAIIAEWRGDEALVPLDWIDGK